MEERLRRGGLALFAALTAAALLAGCSGDQTVRGRYFAVDDTGRPPHPIEDGWMLALPADADATQDVLGVPFPGDGWSYHSVQLEQAEVLAAGGVWEPVGRGGRFVLPVEPGEWIVCVVGDRGGSGPL